MKKLIGAMVCLTALVCFGEQGTGCKTIPSDGTTTCVGEIKKSCDPNEIVGKAGVGAKRYVKPGDRLSYTIYFENKTNATAAAQEVFVDLPMDANLDWTTLQLGEVAFGDNIDRGLFGKKRGTSDYANPGTNTFVRTKVTVENNVLKWYIRDWDPTTTDNFPEDARGGFLPPNDPDTHCGEGRVSFSVCVRTDGTAGERIEACADIQFDDNEIIKTDPSWFNTVAEPATVSFNANGGSGSMAPVETDMDGNVVLPANTFTKSGHTFQGWAKTPSGEVVYSDRWSGNTGLLWGESLTLYAAWKKDASPTPASQTVIFNPNGGTVDPMTKTYAIGSTYDPLPTPTLSGRWFLGWFTAPTDGMQVAATNRVSNATRRTLYAHWFDIPTLKITFYANGGTGSMPPTTVQFGSTVTLPANKFTKKNHAFSGWARSPQGNISWYDKGKVLVNSWGTLPLYAKWQQTGFTISFNANGGSCSTKATTRSLYEYSSDVLPWPTRKGYAFNGWWDKKSGNVYYVSYANFSDSQTVYAKWTKTAKKRYMNFYCNGGKYSGWSSFRKLYTTGRKFGALPVPIRKNHVFLGWYDTISGKTIKLQSSRIVPGEYATYLWNWQAKWAKSKYKVAFCANGGTGSMAVQTIKYGKATKLKANKFKRSGYTFQGWAKSKNGKVVFKNTKSVKNLVTDGKTVKLYAVWKKK